MQRLIAGLLSAMAAIACQSQVSVRGSAFQLECPGFPAALCIDAPGFVIQPESGVDPFARTAVLSATKVSKEGEELRILACVQPLATVPGPGSPALQYAETIRKRSSVSDFDMVEAEGACTLTWREPWRIAEGRAREPMMSRDETIDDRRPPDAPRKGSPQVRDQPTHYMPAGQERSSQALYRRFDSRVWVVGEFLASVTVVQGPEGEVSRGKDLLATVRFGESDPGKSRFAVRGRAVSNEVLPYTFTLPKGWSLKGDSRGIYAEATDESGALTLTVEAEKCAVRDEVSLATSLTKTLEVRGWKADFPEVDLPRSIQKAPCAWLAGSKPSSCSLWLAFTSREDVLLTIACQGPKGRESDLIRCLSSLASSFRWTAPPRDRNAANTPVS